MLPPLFRLESIKQACLDNQLVLTANQRLRSKILQAWGQFQLQQGVSHWQSPRVLSLEQWFQSQWQALKARAYGYTSMPIISDQQSMALWQGIIRDSEVATSEALARQAANAYTMMEKWNLEISHIRDFGADTGIDLYQQWALDYKSRLNDLSMVTPTAAYKIVGQAFSDSTLPQEDSIHLLGFDDIPPAIQQQLQQASPQLLMVDDSGFQPRSLQRLRFDTEQQEIAAICQWAATLLEQNTQLRIGIIVPNLGQNREAIEQALTEQFEAKSLLASSARYTLPFNISAGIPLGQTPLIESVFQLLTLHRQYWSVDALCQLLFSPFWAAYSQEWEQRCTLATQLQNKGVFEVSLSDLRYLAQQQQGEEQYRDGDRPSLFERLSQLYDYQLHNKRPALPSIWMERILRQLDILAWPGERRPDSHEYQQTVLWYQLLEQFANLDACTGVIEQSQALTILHSMARHQP
ncbi:MAG: hypothetical protein AAFZ92_06050, partial [Pseudomonadota bacterium]